MLPPSSVDVSLQASRRGRPFRGNKAKGGGRGAGRSKDEGASLTPLYKTRLCNFYLRGTCSKGSRCPFAHGAEDLWPSPDFERTSVCPVLLNTGRCDKPHCRYAHSAEELRVEPGMVKTKMCSFYLEGFCVVGQACRFAHTLEELQEAVAVHAAIGNPRRSVGARPNEVMWALRRNAFAEQQSFESKQISLSPPGLDQSPNQEPAPGSWSTPLSASLDAALRKFRGPPAPPGFHVAGPEASAANAEFAMSGVRGPDQVEIDAHLSEEVPSANLVENIVESPTQLVDGRVLVKLDDDAEPRFDTDELPPMTILAPAFGVAVVNRVCPTNPEPTPTIHLAARSLARAEDSTESKTARVLVDIEDVDAVAGLCGECHSRPALPPERRRKARSVDSLVARGRDVSKAACSTQRCSLPKTERTPCNVAGRFSECALCPRNSSDATAASGPRTPCAACECGLRVVARNTFLTITPIDDRNKPGAKVRSKSK